ncbi:MAG TPA: hypothetical protein DGR79_03895 [Clostridiales bacterium]|nr:hypothetical protein [Clostridiales bacterium]
MTDSLGRIGAIAARIVRQFRRDPRTIALVFLAPALVMTLLGYVITEKTTPVALGYADLDEGVLVGGRALRLGTLLRDLLADEGLEVHDYADAARLETDVRQADLRAGVVVPPDFTARLLAGEGFEGLRLLLEGSDPVLSADVARRFGAAVQALPRAALARLQATAPPGVPPEVPADPARLAPPGQPAVEYAHGGPDLGTLSYFAPGYVALFAFFFTFLLTSVSFLRERSSGTMERLLASPVRRGEIVLGYLLGFGLFALAQSLIILLYAVYVLGVRLAGSLASAFAVEALLVAVAVLMGIFFSFYARNEFQVIQFIPIVIIPQVVLSGFLTPLETMHEPLRWLAHAMPMTYANRALRAVMIRGWELGTVTADLAALAGFVVLFTVLASGMIKRQVA